MKVQASEKYLQTRQFRLFLPVIIVPIAAIFFWLMGGGAVITAAAVKNGGLNTQLPGASVARDSSKDKMAFYASAEADSTRRLEQMRMDPYRKDTAVASVQAALAARVSTLAVGHVRVEQDWQTRVEAIRQKVNANSQPVGYEESKIAQTKTFQPDPEMESINATLDKLMAIQNPKKNIPINAVTSNVLTVGIGTSVDTTFFGRKTKKENHGAFYGDAATRANTSGAITAIIATEQTLQNGSVVKMELGSMVTVGSLSLPAGTTVFGIASLEGERLLIHIPSIRYQDNLLPVALSVYDLDGLEGIYIPGSLSRDVAKSSADNAIQSAGVTGLDLSLKTQAVAAGVGAAKSLLSRKVKQVRITVTWGYQVLLHDTNQRQ